MNSLFRRAFPFLTAESQVKAYRFFPGQCELPRRHQPCLTGLRERLLRAPPQRTAAARLGRSKRTFSAERVAPRLETPDQVDRRNGMSIRTRRTAAETEFAQTKRSNSRVFAGAGTGQSRAVRTRREPPERH